MCNKYNFVLVSFTFTQLICAPQSPYLWRASMFFPSRCTGTLRKTEIPTWKYRLWTSTEFNISPVTDLLKRPSSDHLLMQTLSIFTLLYLTYSWLYLTKNVGMGHSTPRSPTLNIMKESESQYQCVYILSTFTPTHFGHMLWDVVAISTGGPSRV